VAPFPRAQPERIDAAADAEIAALKEVINAVRNLRGESGVSPAEKVALIAAGDTALVARNAAAMQSIARLSEVRVLDSLPAGPAPAAVSGNTRLMLDIKVDVDAERARMQSNLERHGVKVFHGAARFVDAHTVEVGSQRLSAAHVLIATGSRPHRPDSFPFEHPNVYDSDEIVRVHAMPTSMVVVGGGVIGCEYACLFAALGTKVTVVDSKPTILGFLDTEVVGWLASGTTARAVATGPMARIVADSLQHLTEADRVAMARYLQALPGPAAGAADTRRRTSAPVAAVRGERVYRDHCEDCHGAEGRGAPPHWPALAGNRTVTAASPTNLIRTVLHGGFLPATRTHPRPYGMPPFGPALDDREVAVLSSQPDGKVAIG
jgi:mono/diheme cytochrome c family protein